ncbi:methyltransferase domain-containing protein [Bacillus sp. H-16]|uniref:class I SAM-dependent methyltransferase n=1 Tax=Alteribacter salitolerans TaxID=2912333 RepID=UPI001965C6B0|nr:class I SAM-dependent methyltransferase [Alteribacter salitolerans]MBM7096202.1 methyltransferase domain-containing protein [Alteribacter salitolerans]
MNEAVLSKNKQGWDKVAERFFGRNPLPEYGPFAPNEEDVRLLGNLEGKRVLDIGCGSGHSLLYMEGQNAGELWGIDLSCSQVSAARTVLKDCTVPVTLFESPMEKNPGLPEGYFDLVYSIYALGWTTDLAQTVKNVAGYLKKNGVFIFSWEHPLYNRMTHNGDSLQMTKPYFEEGPYQHSGWNVPVTMQQLKLSTYINTLSKQGLVIEQMVEEVSLSEKDAERHTNSWYTRERASFVPTTIIFKCRKA